MKETTRNTTPRREFLKTAAGATAATALAGVAVPRVHAAEDNTIRLALIGCGGRGSGAVGNALSAPDENVKLIAMADLFNDRLQGSHKALTKQFGDRIDVPPERQFLGFDAYRKAIDCLRPGDVALLTTHAAFRPTHLEYAVEKGVNVFMEKNLASDPGGARTNHPGGRGGRKEEPQNRRRIDVPPQRRPAGPDPKNPRRRTGRRAPFAGLSPGFRRSLGAVPQNGKRTALADPPRIPVLLELVGLFPGNDDPSDRRVLLDQGRLADRRDGVGGRRADSDDCSQNLDSYAIEYSFADGSRALVEGRYVANCFNDFATFVQGTKCAAQFSGNVHAPTVQVYKDQRMADNNIAWRPPRERYNPWQAEWNDLLDAIRNDRPYNESRRAAMSTYAGIMGRAAVHTGRIITWDETLASTLQFCSNVAGLTADSPAPVRADANGRYPVPVPGKWKEI